MSAVRGLAAVVLSAVVLSAVAVLVPGLAASAATTQQTAIKGFVASASRVNYQQVVTFTGTLVAGPAGTPVPDEPIALQLEPNPRLPFAALASGPHWCRRDVQHRHHAARGRLRPRSVRW